ncbi:unnamed protein product [Effrenium voratum]|uniref:Uncharacterized protein n=1 Tax=Effrenium voratum TaxID=2562239 RepID=A0AA36IAS5_9DINO|nr:unnamed protein product [Effrenium voratum]
MADWQDGVVYNTYINCSEDQIALTCYSLGGKEDKYRMRPDATVRNLSEMLQRQVVSMSREGEMSILRPMDRLRDFVSDEDRVVFCTFGWNQILVLQTLEALAKGAFSKSAFNLDWKSTLGVDSRSLEQRVAEHIGQGAPVRVRRYFLQLMQKYLADAEGWKLLDLSLGQHWRHFVPFTGFKHHWTQHAAELCAFSATTPVPQRPPSMFLFRKDPFGHVKDGLPLSADRQFPRPIQQCALLRKGLEFGSFVPVAPNTLHKDQFRELILSMDGIPPHPEEEASVDSLEPSFFEAEELMRLLHVQFRLSANIPALVEGPFDEELARGLAEMLRLQFRGAMPERPCRGSLVLLPWADSWEKLEDDNLWEDLVRPVKFIFLC